MSEEKKSRPEITQGCFAIAVAIVTVVGGLITWYVQENYSITPKGRSCDLSERKSKEVAGIVHL